jgi:DNA-binding GntR family transcriptional regulator
MAADLHRLDIAPDLVDRVYQALLGAISSGALAPGARLTQGDIAAQLAVSRQPVLQALRLLKREGLVHDAPGRGLQVAALDAQSLAHTYQVRGALDALAARLAAERRRALPPALLAAGRSSMRGTDVHAMIEADIAFHRALYAASGNPFIERSAETHWSHIRRAMGAVLQSSRLRRPVWDEHEAIAEAVASGDIAGAERAAATHAEQAGHHMARHLSRPLHDPAPPGATSPRAASAKGPTR